jgi:bifunctional non-homologous end joining protein LigD
MAIELEEYWHKRDFAATPEPAAEAGGAHARPIFVVQEHHASHLHYDFRLEADGVLKSWAVPRGPSLDPSAKRLAVRVEDHPLAYADFEGTIPEGQYGAGTVTIWDRGTYENLLPGRTVSEGIAAGNLEFALHGSRLRGKFVLVRMKGKGRGKENWLLIKKRDEFARAEAGRTASPPRKTSQPAAAPTHPAGAPPAEGVEVTNPDKVLFPDAGITKGEVFEYYRRIAPRLLPFLKDRPVTLERLPDGLGPGKPHFWQKNTPASYPAWLPRVELPEAGGRVVHYAVVNEVNALLFFVNQGTLTFHPWLSRLGSLDRPDFVLFDLDPGEASFADAWAVARYLRGVLEDEGRTAVVKTSGKTGLHVLVSWTDAGGYDQARAWAKAVAERVATALPEQVTVDIRRARRGRRVYVDVLQNARGHHAVSPYVVRAVPGAAVSMPLSWRELREDLDPAAFNVRTVLPRLARRRADPMAPVQPDRAG